MSGILNLNGKKGLIIGIANEKSIAYGCAKVMRAAGAELAVTYFKDKALPHVEPLAKELGVEIFLPLDVQVPEQVQKLFDEIKAKWGKLDFLIHSIAFAPKEDLYARVTDCSLEGFAKAMDISCHSLSRLTRLFEPIMPAGGSIITFSYMGSEKVVPHYNIMGPVKAALESTMRYMSMELGAKGIRVNAISPGPIATRAASGIENFQDLINEATSESPLRRIVSIEEVGNLAAFLVSDLSTAITGHIHFVDAGDEIVG